MIRHVLLFRFDDGVDEETRGEAFGRLRQLGEQCPTVKAWSIGSNFTDSPSAYDMVEIGDFASVEDLGAYRQHPAHREFSDYIRPLAHWALADYDVDEPEDESSLEVAKDIPPFSLILNDAKHNYSNRGNNSYRELRERLRTLTDGELSLSQLGRVMVRLVKGRLPADYFSYVPGKGLTYRGGIENADDIRNMENELGKVTAGHIISIFHKLSS